MRSRFVFSAAVICCAAWTAQAGVVASEPVRREMSIAPLGSFWITNPFGPIDITGSDIERIVITGTKKIYAADRDALNDARENCVVSFEGDDKVRLVRTITRGMVPNARCVVSYTVQLPRSSDVKISSKLGDVRVRNVNGSVTLNGFENRVFFAGVTGATLVDIVNGSVQLEFSRTPISNVEASTINGDINVYVPPTSNFEWIANTLAGDMMTSMPVRGTLNTNTFRGHFNAPGGPLLKTQSLAGRTRVLAVGTGPAQARSVFGAPAENFTTPMSSSGMPLTKMQTPIIGALMLDVPDRMLDISIGEVRGPAKIQIGGGQVELGTVLGDCEISTAGGPLNLGEISGKLQAKTGAGDILVRAARLGGEIRTAGGIIRVLYTGGPTTLQSGGGDIVVRQVAGSINAQTPSGDIALTIDPTVKTQKMEARTGKGNIILNVPPKFAGTIDATVMTSDPDVNAIQSDFPALTIRRDQVGGRTRIHLTGKINGGGDRIELYTENGDITINAQAQAPVTVVNPAR